MDKQWMLNVNMDAKVNSCQVCDGTISKIKFIGEHNLCTKFSLSLQSALNHHYSSYYQNVWKYRMVKACYCTLSW